MDQHDDLNGPLTAEDLAEIESTVQATLQPIREYLTIVRGAAVDPALFLQLPEKQELLQNLIDAYAAIYDLLPEHVFQEGMDEMLRYPDQLYEAEDGATNQGVLPPLFTLELEYSDSGHPRLAIPREFVEMLIQDVGLTNQETADILGCSLRTLERRLQCWGIRRHQQTLSDEDLFALVQELKRSLGLFHGERAICGMLRAMKHWAPRWKVREIIRGIDPKGVNARWKRAIVRRVYSVPFVNSLWHINGYHKLIRWKIVIHGGVDGKSRLVVFLKASDNNRAATVAEVFADATESYGWPSRVRADWGGENLEVKRMMEEVRGAGRASFLAGPSTHNQRIERLWRDLFSWTIQPFYTLFATMEQQGILDTTDDKHLWALHFVFLPRINKALSIFTSTWNNHKLSSQQNKTPYQLYLRGQMEARQRGFWLNPGNRPALDDTDVGLLIDFTQYGADMVGAQRERREDDPHVECTPPAHGMFTDLHVQWLEGAVSWINDEADFYGTDKYLYVVRLLQQLPAL